MRYRIFAVFSGFRFVRSGTAPGESRIIFRKFVILGEAKKLVFSMLCGA
jgi:hypothetical protein